eukprot:IDg21204t1
MAKFARIKTENKAQAAGAMERAGAERNQKSHGLQRNATNLRREKDNDCPFECKWPVWYASWCKQAIIFFS